MTFLLDTNIIIAALNKDVTIESQLSENMIFISTIVLGELYYGARKSGRPKENLATIESFAAKHPILDCDKQTAEQYGLIKQALEAKGGLIPENDMWIAALAKQHSLTLVTRDEHFKRVDGLLLTKC